MDIHAAIITATVLSLIAAFFAVRAGIRTIRSARVFSFQSLRRQRAAVGWRILLLALLLFTCAWWLPFYGEPLVFEYFPPSPTPSLTPTITLTPTISPSPTISLTPTLTNTPSVTDTPTLTLTPYLPLAIEALITSRVTPDPRVFFSLQFTTAGNRFPAVDPATVFQNPVGHMYAVFSYSEMTIGAQWTALWLRDGELVHYETQVWECPACSTGGSGYTDWNPTPDQWLPGNYEVQIFAGGIWAGSGRFIVQGEAPTAVPTVTSTPAPGKTQPEITPTP